MTVDEAGALVRERYELPIPLVLDRRHRLAPPPEALGATAHFDEALARARTAPPGASITLPVLVDGNVVRTYVLQVAKRFYRKPVDAQVFLRHLKPVIVPDRPGLVVNRLALTTAIVQRLRITSRVRVKIRHSSQPAATKRTAFRSVIVIRRSSNQLYLYRLRPAAENVPRRDRPVDLPDAARPLRHPRQVAEPLVVPAELPLGERARSRSRRARATRSARAGWACPRRASGSTGRRTRPRSATRSRTAASGCTSRTPNGCSTPSTSGRRCSSSRPDAEAEARGSGRRRSGSSAALLVLLVWKVVQNDRTNVASSFTKGHVTRPRRLRPQAPERERKAGAVVAQGQGRGRQLLGLLVRAVQERGAAASSRRSSATASASRSSASTRRTTPVTRASSSAATASRTRTSATPTGACSGSTAACRSRDDVRRSRRRGR